ncbi:hypothetical protein J4G08_13335, partial [Candidatus Poribacteria bacterium]|nr:hypothetical protein [Candidatus Poribacteria bacterium]
INNSDVKYALKGSPHTPWVSVHKFKEVQHATRGMPVGIPRPAFIQINAECACRHSSKSTQHAPNQEINATNAIEAFGGYECQQAFIALIYGFHCPTRPTGNLYRKPI